MLIDELKKANLEAMKARDNDARAALSVVLTRYKLQEVEARSQGKEIGDAECLSIIQKVLKELNDEKFTMPVVDKSLITKVQKDKEKSLLPLSEEEQMDIIMQQKPKEL